jgi:hypothetical protein
LQNQRKTAFHCDENNLSSQWLNVFIAMEKFFHRDERKLFLDVVFA